MNGVAALLAPPIEVLNRLPLADREQVSWLAEMGMPAQGPVVTAIRRITEQTRREQLIQEGHVATLKQVRQHMSPNIRMEIDMYIRLELPIPIALAGLVLDVLANLKE